MKIEAKEIPPRDFICHIRSTISKDGEIEEDVEHRIRATWLKWRFASGVLCDWNIPTRLKEKIYRTAIKPAMTDGEECWAN